MAIYKGDGAGIAMGGGKKAFIGVNGLAKEVKLVYAGDESGTARIVYGAHGYTEQDPFLISTAQEFFDIADAPDACYRLTADIEVNTVYGITDFKGSFDGAGHKIIPIGGRSLFYNNWGTVKNLYKYNSPAGREEPALCYYNYGVIDHCYLRGICNKASETQYAGAALYSGKYLNRVKQEGAIGLISNCYSFVAVEKSPRETAGFVKSLNGGGLITGCFCYTDINNQYGTAAAAFAASLQNLQNGKEEALPRINKCYWKRARPRDNIVTVINFNGLPNNLVKTGDIRYISGPPPDLDFESHWYFDEDGNLALKGMGKMDLQWK